MIHYRKRLLRGIALCAVAMLCAAGTFRLYTAYMEDVLKYLPIQLSTLEENSLEVKGSSSFMDGTLLLTSDVPEQWGAAHSRTQPLGADRSFSAYFSFSLPTQSGNEGGDGLWFFLTPSDDVKEIDGSPANKKKTLMVEFDMFADEDLPPEFEPDNNHISIFTEDIAAPLALRSLQGRLGSGETYHAWVDYNGTSGILELRLDTSTRRPEEAALSAMVPSSYLPERVSVGFLGKTGATGTTAHIVKALMFSRQYSPIDPEASYVDSSSIQLSIVAEEENERQIQYAIYAADSLGRVIYGVPVSLSVNNGALLSMANAVTDEQGIARVLMLGGEATKDSEKTTLIAQGPGDAKATIEVEGLVKNAAPEVQQSAPDRLVGNEDQPLRFTSGMFEMYYIDTDNDPFCGIYLKDLPEVGEMLLGDTLVGADVLIPADQLNKLSYLPPAEYSTPADAPLKLTWQVYDGMARSATTAACEIEIRHINHPPTFDYIGDLWLTSYSSKEQVIENWAYNISPGLESEQTQELTFKILSNDNPDMFLEQPTISETGALRFTLSENANAEARLRIQLSDNAGTENGGLDTSDPVVFVIGFDNEPPAVAFPVVRSSWQNRALWDEMNCTDTGSGVKRFEYAITTKPTPPSLYDNQPPEAETGTFYIHALAEDNAGNQLKKTVGPFRIDRTAPTTPELRAEITNDRLVASAHASDAHSGVALYQFGLNGVWSNPSSEANVTFNGLSSNGLYVVSVRAIDTAGNASSISYKTLVTAPATPKVSIQKQTGNVLISIDPMGNDANTLYQVIRFNAQGEVDKTWDWSTALSYVDEIISGVKYEIKVQPKTADVDVQEVLAQAQKLRQQEAERKAKEAEEQEAAASGASKASAKAPLTASKK